MSVESSFKFGVPGSEFPKLVILSSLNRREDERYIVLMNAEGRGMVVSRGISAQYSVGYYCDNWAKGHFEDFVGTVELKG